MVVVNRTDIFIDVKTVVVVPTINLSFKIYLEFSIIKFNIF